MALEWLTQPSAPPNVNTTQTSVGQIPQWLSDYQAGIAGKAVGIAGQGYTPYPGQRLAGFTPDQNSAFKLVKDNIGDWSPELNSARAYTQSSLNGMNDRLGQAAGYGSGAVGAAGAAAGNANQIAQGAGTNANQIAGNTWNTATGIAQNAGNMANSAVSGNAQNWTDNWQQYMSPFTQNVVNEIGRLGNRNLMENIVPQVQNQFLGAGQFGSTRNADILGRSIRDAQADISGRQAQALESGYGTAANIFGADAGRQQQQQQLQAQTALGAGNLGANTATTAGSLGAQTALGAGNLGANTAISGGNLVSNANISAGQLANQGAQIGANGQLQAGQQLGALGQLRQNLGMNDANALGNVGALQQQLAQKGLDIGYEDFINQRDWDRNQLSWLSGMTKNNVVPQSSTQTSSAPLQGAAYGPSTLDYINSAAGLAKNTGLWDKLFG